MQNPSGLIELGSIEHNPWSPLSISLYRNFWLAGLLSNVGTLMHEAGAQWLMTDLSNSPEMVSAVRAAMTLPVFFFALPAGVIADRLDRRTWLLCTQSSLLLVATIMAITDLLGLMTPLWLLSLTACMGTATILNQPAWQALTPELVPRELVPTAVATGSVSFNLARAIGPAVGGLLIASCGTWATFLFNAASFAGVILVLVLWKPQSDLALGESSGSFWFALVDGLRFVVARVELRSVLIRVVGFAFSASILWSLLSLVAKEKLQLQASGFGGLLATIGFGAVWGAWLVAPLRRIWTSERIVLVSSAMYAAVCGLISFSRSIPIVTAGLVFIGISWLACMTTLNATAQMHLPANYRARGMATYLMAFAFGMSCGSVFWGWLATSHGLDISFALASITMLAFSAGAHRLRLGSLSTQFATRN